MKKYVLAILAFYLLQTVNAQLTTVCGTDTIILQVDNYFNGNITWEQSLDNENWLSISDASGPTYKFLPTETKYYRAVVYTTECDPLCSPATLIQMPPKAYAGTDRKIGGSKTKLLGSTEVNATGTWSILEGTGGMLGGPSNPYSEFSGTYGQAYKLIWTTTNGCGQSSDTVSFIFEEIISKDNFIVVDLTDEILGDSLERTTGIYRIKFSDASIVPSDTMLLIGMRPDISFLVKIQSFYMDNDVYVFTTTPGSLEDIIQTGTMNVGDAVNEGMAQDGKKNKTSFPTRETLKHFIGNKNQVVIYSSNFMDKDGYRVNMMKKATNKTGLKLSVPDMDLFQTEDEALKLSLANAYIRFEPNFVCDFEVGFFTLNNIKIGLDNGEFEYNYKLRFEATAKKELSKELTILEYTNYVVFMIGVVPVVISTSIALNAEASIYASATLVVTEEKNYQKNFTALLVGENIKDVHFVSSSYSKSTSTSDYIMQGKLGAEFSVGPEISVELYSVIGPYFELPLTLSAEICVNTDKNWYAEAGLGIEGNLGVKAHLGSLKLFDIKKTLFKADLIKPLQMPYRINVLSGNYQKGVQDAVLPRPINIKVTSSYGFGVPLVPVRFSLDDGNGSVNNSVLFTNMEGKVTVNDWKLGNNPDARLDISVLNCENEDIEDFSPVSAYASGIYNCANTDLSIILTKGENGIVPKVMGGKEPFTYSTNGTNFSTTVPEFLYANAGKYMIYVKDANSCNANRNVTVVAQDPCTASPLFIDVYKAANTIQFIGLNGKAPYQFSIDNAASFTENNLYSNLTPGKHAVHIQDANNCASVDTFEVELQENKAVNAHTPVHNAKYYRPENIVFKWQAALFANNQTYDVYLKKGEEAYTNIAQNLTEESFTHAATLDYSTLYTWKVVIKDQAGAEKENAEFSFTTMADPAIVATTPTLLQPASYEKTDTTVTFKWQSQGGDFKYDFFLDGRLYFYSLTADSVVIPRLLPGMVYEWKVKIKSPTNADTYESETRYLEVKSLLPVLTTNNVSAVTQISVTCGGNITSEGLAPVTAYGLCWSLYPQPTIDSTHIEIGSGVGIFSGTLTGLTAQTAYYVRAYATTANGTSYGNEIKFSTRALDPVDGSGNQYNTVILGDQEWMTSNLRTTKYSDGTDIPNVTDQDAWGALTSPAYCWYNNVEAESYGALYNWFAVDTLSNGNKNVCPNGWRVPTDADWTELEIFLQNNDYNYNEMSDNDQDRETNNLIAKSMASGQGDLWRYDPYTEGAPGNWDYWPYQNKTKLSIHPAGKRHAVWTFALKGESALFWTSTPNNATTTWSRLIYYSNVGTTRTSSTVQDGISVRCIMK